MSSLTGWGLDVAEAAIEDIKKQKKTAEAKAEFARLKERLEKTRTAAGEARDCCLSERLRPACGDLDYVLDKVKEVASFGEEAR